MLRRVRTASDVSEQSRMSGVHESSAGPLALGIDTGGTFTDLVALGADGSVRVAEASSTPDAPLGALLSVLNKAPVPGAAIELIVQGTRVATNTFLQRRRQHSNDVDSLQDHHNI